MKQEDNENKRKQNYLIKRKEGKNGRLWLNSFFSELILQPVLDSEGKCTQSGLYPLAKST